MYVAAAIIKIFGSNMKKEYTLDFHISLEPCMLYDGIHAFARQVANMVSNYLYEILWETGTIQVTLVVEVVCINGKFDYRQEINEPPSKKLKGNLDNLCNNIAQMIQKDLAFDIIQTEKFKSQGDGPFLQGGNINAPR